MKYTSLDNKRAYERAYYQRTRERRLELSKQRYKKDPKAFSKTNRKGVLKRKYGLTLEEYQYMFVNQNGKCLLCEREENGRLLAVDHNHNTDKVRGLLCGSCNRALGLFGDRLDVLEKAVDYIKAHGDYN